MPKLAAVKAVFRNLFATNLDGELVAKIILVILMLPLVLLLFIVAPTTIIESVPLAEPFQIQFYKDAAQEINNKHNLSIDWEEILALDAVLLKQDFSLSSRGRADNLVAYFWEEYEEEYIYTVDVETTVICGETGDETTIVEEEERVGTRIVYKEVSLDSVITQHGLTDRQTEKVFRLLSMGLSQVLEQMKAYGDDYAIGASLRHEVVGFCPDLFHVFDNHAVFPIITPSFRVSSPFGMRRLRGDLGFHHGIDLVGGQGYYIGHRPVVAVLDGTVVLAGWNSGWGNWVVINHSDYGNFHTQYAHLHQITQGITEGVIVVAGEQIGTVGNTGRSYGSHLHFEIRPEGTKRLDPHEYVFASRRILPD